MRSTTKVNVASMKGEYWLRVVDNRVACPRIGWADLRRCAECVYLVRLEMGAEPRTARGVVCSDADLGQETAFRW